MFFDYRDHKKGCRKAPRHMLLCVFGWFSLGFRWPDICIIEQNGKYHMAVSHLFPGPDLDKDGTIS